MRVRRVVTGHDATAKAVFVSDQTVVPIAVPGINFEFLRLWSGDTRAAFPDSGAEPPAGTYFPAEAGFRFGIFTIPPVRSVPLTLEERRAAFLKTERLFPGLLAHMEPDNPGMHTSDSIDFGYVISGRIWLELDDGSMKELVAGDTYVQNGTRHAWRNHGSEPCHILVVLLGAQREPSGLSIARTRRAP